MKTRFLFIGLFFVLGGIFYLHPVFAQTISLTPATLDVEPDSSFSLTLNVASVSNLFGVAFDLDFNPSLVRLISTDEGTFLSPGCQTSLLTAENPAGKLIVGLSRLGASCGGVSGSGTLMTFNFSSLSQAGTNNFSFSNNSLCLLEDSSCNYVTGTWTGASVTIGAGLPPTDTTPPVRSNGSPSGELSAGTSQTTLSLTTNENATCKYSTNSGVSYSSMTNTFSTTGGVSHSTNVSGLTDSNTYNYYIKCQDTAGNANPDDDIITFSIASAAPDTIPPSTPTNLQATAISSSQINLSWSPSTDNVGVTGYRIYRDSTYLTSTSNTSYSNTGLSPLTNHTYTVSAYDISGNNSSQSSSSSTTTFSRADLNNDGQVNLGDFIQLITRWLRTTNITNEDLNNDNRVDTRDLGMMMSGWAN